MKIKKENLQKKILAGLIAMNICIYVGDAIPNVYANTAVQSHSNALSPKAEPTETPLSFTERVKRILDEYHDKVNHKNTIEKENTVKDAAASKEAVTVDEYEEKNEPMLTTKISAHNETKPNIAEGTYSFDWRGTPLSQSLYSVAKIANKGIVINANITGQVYLSLKNVTCNQALDYLSSAFNFNWMTDPQNGTIIISNSDLMKQSKVFQVNYIDKDKVKAEFAALGIQENNIYANSETGTVSVTATPYQLSAAARKLSELDRPVSQCLLVAQLIEISHGKSVDLGMKYSLPTYTHSGQDDSSSSTLKGNFFEKLTFSASASASKELSNGKVIARPLIMVKNGEEGLASFGDKVPVLSETSTNSSTSVTVEYHDVGTTLKIKPTINAVTGDVSMQIEAEVSNISKWITSGQTAAPQISTRKTQTSAHLKSGQSFVIGGLMSVNELDNLSGIPGLMDLPILGKLFSYHSREKSYAEVYIMITPFIVDDADNMNVKEILRQVEVAE